MDRSSDAIAEPTLTTNVTSVIDKRLLLRYDRLLTLVDIKSALVVVI